MDTSGSVSSFVHVLIVLYYITILFFILVVKASLPPLIFLCVCLLILPIYPLTS